MPAAELEPPPTNPLCTSSHPSDTVHKAMQVVMFLQDAIPSQLKEDDPQTGAAGISWCLMMVADALAYADEQIKARAAR